MLLYKNRLLLAGGTGHAYDHCSLSQPMRSSQVGKSHGWIHVLEVRIEL
ncbi:hypothetical protein BS78_01G401900 [Paspalum vaginatum]|nr:hypothetical protein BS78_01G401900 [Paspalum vaginatum]